MTDFTLLDLAAVAVFLGAWIAYHLLTEVSSLRARSLNAAMDRFRAEWMEEMVGRDVRIVDTQIMASLQNGAAFFASTSIFAIGGSLAALGATDTALEVFATLPYAPATTGGAYDAKVLGLTAIFVYAFYKFGWSYRLFNYAAIMIGAAPPATEAGTTRAREAAARAGRMNAVAGRHFNRGLRAFFFALAYLGWFAGPWVLMATTACVLVVLLRRQLASDSLAVAG